MQGKVPKPVQDIAWNDKDVGSQPGQTKTTTVKKRKPQKRGLMEAFAHGLKVAIPTATQAAKLAYEQGRVKQASEQEKPPTVQSVPSQHNTFTESQVTALAISQQGETQPYSPQAPRLYLDFESPDASRNQSYTRSLPVHIDPLNKGSGSPYLGNGSTGGVMLSQKPLSHDPQTPHMGETFLIDEESTKGHNESSSAEYNTLLRIQNLVLTTGYDFPVLRGPPGEAVEDTVKRFIGSYRYISDALDRESQSFKEVRESLHQYQEQSATLKDMETELHTMKNSLRSCNTELDDKSRELSNKQRELSYLEGRLQSLQSEHSNQMRAEQQKLCNETEKLKTWYEEQIRKARSEEKQRQEHAISLLKQQLTDEHWKWDKHLRQKTEEYEARIREAQPEFERRTREQNEQHSQQMRFEQERYGKMVTDYQAQISQFKIDADEEKLRLREEVQTAQATLQEEQKRREKELKRQESLLNQKHVHETFQLRSVNEELKQGLFQRQHFKGLRDRDLTGQFRTIVGQVQDFANLEWDSRRESDWPFSEYQLLEIHRSNIRKLKKQIIQNSLWVLLYDYIFGSPFRILGAEGRELDSDWTQIHAADTSSLEWPEISADAEKRRYESAKSFLGVMEPPARLSGDNLRLKTSYEVSISMTLDALYRALGRVAILEARHDKILVDLVRLCAKTWLEFCSQPYRLLVSLPKGSGDLLSSPRTNERALTLVLNPELKRYGNSQGENLVRGDVVPDCQAAVQSYFPR